MHGGHLALDLVQCHLLLEGPPWWNHFKSLFKTLVKPSLQIYCLKLFCSKKYRPFCEPFLKLSLVRLFVGVVNRSAVAMRSYNETSSHTRPAARPEVSIWELAVSFFFKARGEICYHLCNLRVIVYNPDNSRCAIHELYFWLRPPTSVPNRVYPLHTLQHPTGTLIQCAENQTCFPDTLPSPYLC